jgi:hypothetical protein
MKRLFLGSVALVALSLGTSAAFAAEKRVPAPSEWLFSATGPITRGHQESNTRSGWTVGGGIEYAVGYGWSKAGLLNVVPSVAKCWLCPVEYPALPPT